jgi:hypothetical protein
VGSVSGGLGVGLIMVKLLESGEPPHFAAIRKEGGSYTRVADRDSRTGRPKGLPRTAAIKSAGVVRPEIDGLRDPITDVSATDPQ